MPRRSPVRVPVVALALCVTCLSAAASLAARGKDKDEAGILKTFTIAAIDAQGKVLTLKDAAGGVETMGVSPTVPKVNELKVGDRVAVRYLEPLLVGVRQAGQPPAADAPPPSPAEVTATVDVTATDAKVPSLSVKTEDGQALTFQVGDKKVIEALKPGDKVTITYMRPLAIKIEKK